MQSLQYLHVKLRAFHIQTESRSNLRGLVEAFEYSSGRLEAVFTKPRTRVRSAVFIIFCYTAVHGAGYRDSSESAESRSHQTAGAPAPAVTAALRLGVAALPPGPARLLGGPDPPAAAAARRRRHCAAAERTRSKQAHGNDSDSDDAASAYPSRYGSAVTASDRDNFAFLHGRVGEWGAGSGRGDVRVPAHTNNRVPAHTNNRAPTQTQARPHCRPPHRAIYTAGLRGPAARATRTQGPEQPSRRRRRRRSPPPRRRPPHRSRPSPVWCAPPCAVARPRYG